MLEGVEMETVEDRSIVLGRYIVENNATVRSTAKIFGISKSTVHIDVTKLNSLNVLIDSDFTLHKRIAWI